uniref:zinc-binding dehydrogenase n=1 Tax=Altererythrobacter sp. TaxID=1872480 RepID=UPI003D03E3F4
DGARVTLIDTRQARLDHARNNVGIDDTLLVSDTIIDDLAAATDGEFFDCVFDATGNIRAMSAGLEYVAHGGSYVLISVVKDDLTFPDPEFHKRETTLLGSRNATAADFARVIAAIRGGELPMDQLHTHSIDIVELPLEMPRLIERADSVLKAIVAV